LIDDFTAKDRHHSGNSSGELGQLLDVIVGRSRRRCIAGCFLDAFERVAAIHVKQSCCLTLRNGSKQARKSDPDDYPADILGLYTYNGKYYAVPKDIDTIALMVQQKTV
jgi:hypothetical protein